MRIIEKKNQTCSLTCHKSFAQSSISLAYPASSPFPPESITAKIKNKRIKLEKLPF